jgi:small subunit ribosomal protein S4e
VPLGLILRDMLHVCDTAREARHILNTRKVLVDGRVVTDPAFPVGLMDVLSLGEAKAHYRMMVSGRGRMTLVGVEGADATWKLCRIEDKTTVRGGKTQLNLHDGRNLLLAKDQYKPGTTLKIQVPSQKILGHYDLAPGAVSFISGGQHVGEIARVDAVRLTRNPRANVVTFREGFSTDVDKVFVIGKDAPEVRIPEAPAV